MPSALGSLTARSRNVRSRKEPSISNWTVQIVKIFTTSSGTNFDVILVRSHELGFSIRSNLDFRSTRSIFIFITEIFKILNSTVTKNKGLKRLKIVLTVEKWSRIQDDFLNSRIRGWFNREYSKTEKLSGHYFSPVHFDTVYLPVLAQKWTNFLVWAQK